MNLVLKFLEITLEFLYFRLGELHTIDHFLKEFLVRKAQVAIEPFNRIVESFTLFRLEKVVEPERPILGIDGLVDGEIEGSHIYFLFDLVAICHPDQIIITERQKEKDTQLFLFLLVTELIFHDVGSNTKSTQFCEHKHDHVATQCK